MDIKKKKKKILFWLINFVFWAWFYYKKFGALSWIEGVRFCVVSCV